MKKLWANRWFRTLAGFLLVAALLAPVLLPAAQLQRQEPENPIREENIQPVNVLSFGETDGGTRASAPLTFTQDTNAEGGQTEQDNEQPPEEETDDTPPELPTETIPQPEPVNDPTHTDTQPGENAEDVPGDAGRADGACTGAGSGPRLELVPLCQSACAPSARQTRPSASRCAPHSFRTAISGTNWTCVGLTRRIRRSPM